MNSRIDTADHTGITVSDLERSLAFWRDVLGFRPGITDLASLIYRDEEQVLAMRGHDLDRYYREVILPEKLSLNLRYCAKRSLWLDLKLIGLTIRYSFIPKGFDRDRVRQQFPLL